MEAESQNILLNERVQSLVADLKAKSDHEKEIENQISELRSEMAIQKTQALNEQSKLAEAEKAQIVWRRRMTKMFLIIIIWIGAAALFIAIDPLAKSDDLRWQLALTIPVIALVISQIILVIGYWPSDVSGKIGVFWYVCPKCYCSYCRSTQTIWHCY